MSTVLVIDNYDSFTFNIVNYLKRAGAEKVYVVRNDKTTIEHIKTLPITHIVVSPGPGSPDDAGISISVIREFSGSMPILGVCLGLQAMVQAFGGTIVSAVDVVHGKIDTITHDGTHLFRSFTGPVSVARYHSLAAEQYTIPECLEITARSSDGEIMGVRHKEHPTEGVQFHPESVGTERGLDIIRNFLNNTAYSFSVKECLTLLTRGQSLGLERALFAAEEISNRVLKDTQIAALVMGISARGITEEELSGFAQTFYHKARQVRLPDEVADKTVDIVGTGGDGLKTCNISTLSSLTLAAMLSPHGYKVAKHGNKSVSSSSGSSDVLERLGWPLGLEIPQVRDTLLDHGFAFFFAPLYHSTFKHLAPVRKDMGIATIMNFLGPIINPTNLKAQLLGVSRRDMCEPILHAALHLGRERAWAVRGEDEMDEISVCAPTELYEATPSGVKTHTIAPPDVGLAYHSPEKLVVRDANEAADVARECLQGRADEAIIDAVSANAGAAHALVTGAGIQDIRQSVVQIKDFLRTGAAWSYFESVKTAACELHTQSQADAR